jgi:serine protease Do
VNDQPQKITANAPKSNVSRIVGTVLLCFVASFMGAWFFISSGIVPLDASRTISDNREKIVLAEGEIVADVFNKVSPSTVSITTQSVSRTNDFFFGPQSQLTEGAGSGIIVSKDGYVLTNKHVVPEGTSKVKVILHDGKEYDDVKVIGRDPTNDIAFLKINGVNDLTAAAIGDSSEVKPGQKVVAIGNALGIFRNSVTSGIVSGLGRPIQASDGQGMAESLENLFQTDAAINPGNSGGPLVNLKGEVIGINTAVAQQGDAIGFAIPINDAKGLLNGVLATGKVTKPYLGVRYVTLDPQVAQELNLNVSEGALVRAGGGSPAVVSNSPAAKAGLRDGDIITKVNNRAVAGGTGLASHLAQYKVGDELELTILRGGREEKIKIKLEAYPQQ